MKWREYLWPMLGYVILVALAFACLLFIATVLDL